MPTTEEIINNVWESLCSVEKIFFKYPTLVNQSKYGERVFAYEFYHQLRQRSQYIEYAITGEAVKAPCTLPALTNTIIPDFVIHNYGTNDNNEVAIEIKTHPKTSLKAILSDIEKLDSMSKPILNYRKAIFIIANYNLANKLRISRQDEIKNRLRNVILNNRKINIWNVLPEALVEGNIYSPINRLSILKYDSNNINSIYS